MKKSVFLIITTLFLFSCSLNDDFTIENEIPKTENLTGKLAVGQHVKLIKAKDTRSYVCRYGTCASYQMREYIVEVKNLNYNKSVVIHQELHDGQWEDISLTYDSSTTNGTEIWKTQTVKTIYGNNPTPTNAYGEKLAVRYETNGQTYWDNNYGNNYFIANVNRHSNSTFLILTDGFNILQSNGSFYSFGNTSFISVIADIKNIAFTKEVKIVYSTDNWVTTNEYNLSFDASNYVINDSTGFERWSASFSVPFANSISYALAYKVNGITYWDNNFGQNYTLIYPTN